METDFDKIFGDMLRGKNKPIPPPEGATIQQLIENMNHNIKCKGDAE